MDTQEHFPTMKNKKKFYTISFFACATIIFILSSYPRLDPPFTLPSSFLEPDKIVHFLQYFIFSYLYFMFRQSRNIQEKEILCELFFLGIFIPLLDELHQIPIPGRSFEWYDAIADMMGFYIFVTIRIIWSFIYKTWRTNENH